MKGKDGYLITKWKAYTCKCVRRRFGHAVNMDKVESYLNYLLETELRNPRTYWVNNYKHAVVSSDLITAIESVMQTGLIMGGAATTYAQHAITENPFRDFIIMLRNKRNAEKAERKKYERGVDEMWNVWDRKQNNTKIVSNSLYGVLGYAKFIFYNVFLAEAITRMGRVIIATAATGFENFLCDNVVLATEGEVYEYVSNIIDEWEEKWRDFNFGILETDVSVDQVIDRLVDKCGFKVQEKTKNHLRAMINRVPFGCRFLLFYKNNFMAFNRIPAIQAKIVKIVNGLDSLMLPDIEKIEDPEIRAEIADLWKFYDACVFYNFPIYDNVRKMAYGTRKAVLYIDTDSNFISLARWVEQIQHEFLRDSIKQDYKDFVFICSNLLTIFLTEVVDRNLKMFAKNCGISEEWRTYLSMKNEFFFWRILFGDVKKRYVDLQMIQEGKLLKDGNGLPEIKGYDFRKFSTKAPIREFYTNLCLEKILRPDNIDLQDIMADIYALQEEVSLSMLKGESKYFKQANVSSPEHYANPLRISGIKGVMLWNCMCPDMPIDLPAEVDLIPIKDLSSRKNAEWFKQQFPEMYEKVEREIFQNRNSNIAKMRLNVIAKPHNDNIEMPDWLTAIMDTGKIVNSTIKLIHPIMESLGVKIGRPTKNQEYLTNLVDL